MSPNRHSISAVSTAKKLNTPLKASVVLLTAVILASCSTSGGDNSITPKPTPVLPGVEDGGTGGENGGDGTDGENSGGETSGGIEAIKAAEARAKDAEAKATAAEVKTKAAEAKTKAAEAKVAEAAKAVDVAKKEAQAKIEALEKASKTELSAAKKATKTAQEALKAAEDNFKVESSKAAAAAKEALDAARAEATEAKLAAQAARAEAVAKIEAAAKASKADVESAKKSAAEAVEKVKVAEEKAKAADTRATVAEEKAQEIQESLKAETAAKEAAQAKTKAAVAETKKAQDKAKTAEEKATAAVKAVADAKADAAKKILDIEKASADQIAAAREAAKVAQEALKTAEANAVVAAKAAAKAAAEAAEAAANEAAAKLEAVKTASVSQIDAAKKEAAAAQARADKAVADAAVAQKRAEIAETTAKLEAEKSAKALKAQATAEKATENAQAAAKDAIEAKEKAEATAAAAEKAKADAEKALEEALANGGGSEALHKEAERKAKLAEQAQAEAEAAQAAAQAAQQAAAAQVAAAQQAQQAAEAALAAAAIKNAPESKKTGVQALNIEVKPLNQAFNTTTRDFNASANSVEARADTASNGLLPIVNITTSGADDTNLQNGFKSHDDSTEITTALGALPLTYSSTYKDFGDDMRIGHIDGSAALGEDSLPVNGVAVVGNATQAANMPTEGTVGYTGDATYRKLGIGSDIEFGKSVFTADFVAQNVKGDLTFANAGKIGLTAGIDGNQFSGSADANGGYATEGGFFGGDAQYLGGVYAGNDAQGTYGATSDKQTAAQAAVKAAKAQAQALAQALATAQADAQAAQAAAAKAQADAVKAKADAEKAQEAANNAGNASDALQDALDRAAEAERLQAEAEEAARVAVAAAQAEADAAKKSAIAAQAEAKAKVEAAEALADQGTAAAAAAKKEAAAAQARADKAETEAVTAKKKADAAVKSSQIAESEKQAALQAKADAELQAAAAQAQAQTEKQKAAAAQAEADKAKGELATAQADLAAAEKALADALASGGGNTEALQAEVNRRQAALDAANAKIIATEQAQVQAAAVAAAQVAAAEAAQQAAEAALAAAEIKNAPEANKSGVQSINVGTTAAGLPSDFIVTTRDFEIGENNVIARADIASGDLLPKVDVNISGAGDADLQNGFKSHNDNTEITTALGVLPLTYTSTYKDFSDDMRIGHIDGAASLNGTDIPVNGVAVVGNATQAANMPTEGKVGYTGDATYRKLGIGNDIEFGKSVFTADFVTKNVKGDLTFANAGKIGLTAGINGNQFSGTTANNAGYNTEGGFFGGDAQYLGGVYEGNGAQGTYGAKSDKQTAAEKTAKEAQAQAATAEAATAAAQAQATAAQAAAEKAKADAVKAQEALAAAEDALANAGTGDGGLTAALERAATAEAAQAAAEAVATTAEAARVAAQAAQLAAEESALKAKAAADKAIGEAKVEADKKVAAANQQATDAKARADKAEADVATAKAAKLEAEARAKAAEEALEAAQQLPPAPTNPQAPVNATITGFQNTISGSDNSSININTSANYDTLKVNILETGSGRYDKNTTTDFALRDAGDEDYEAGFKKSALYSLPAGYLNRRFKYTSAYKNYDGQMQIGHLYGDLKTTNNGIRLDTLSNVYVQGNSTDNVDMQYVKDLSQYNIDNGINDGKVDYKGDASYIGNSTDEIIGHDPIIGTSEFAVDFVDKQVDGTLSFEGSNVSEKKIKAEITGNTFAGNWNGIDTKGGFYGEDAKLLGGVYQVSGGKGTYGATKVDPSAAPAAVESKMTGFQSTALSSKEKTLPFGLGQLDNAIGYVEIRDDQSAWTELKTENGSQVPVDNGKGDNFNSFNKGKVLADMVKPDSVLKPIEVSLTNNGSVTVDAGKGGQNPTFKYSSVYKNFDSQMQVGHVYGNFDSLAGEVSRAANVYVEGYSTSQYGMDNLKTINDGKAQYNGVATYIENIHLADNASTAPVNGTSAFNVDFVDGKVDGTLSFTGTDYKYMPEGNQIGIAADITGNTFAGNKNGIDTAGGFYGEEGKFLGGIYQDAAIQGGKGTVAGTGTKFQGTFGAEKQ